MIEAGYYTYDDLKAIDRLLHLTLGFLKSEYKIYGLCSLIRKMYIINIIDNNEYYLIKDYILNNPPENRYNSRWFFKSGLKRVRIKYLLELIKNL